MVLAKVLVHPKSPPHPKNIDSLEKKKEKKRRKIQSLILKNNQTSPSHATQEKLLGKFPTSQKKQPF
jgi:hypothetical protein